MGAGAGAGVGAGVVCACAAETGTTMAADSNNIRRNDASPDSKTPTGARMIS